MPSKPDSEKKSCLKFLRTGISKVAKRLKAAGKTEEAIARAVGDVGGVEKVLDSAKNFGLKNEQEVKSFVTDLATPKRSGHILIGDSTGGGHMHPGRPGKTVFPQSWDGNKIMHEVSDIVTDPTISWEANKTVRGIDRFKAKSVRDGVEIEVIVEPKGEGIISAWPVSGQGVIKNP